MHDPFIIGIAGGTGSGKTCITDAIHEQVKDELTIISQDSYYKPFESLPLEERRKINFDHPNSLDMVLLIEHVRALKSKVPIEMPCYDFKNHCRKEETITKLPNPIIIVEGILIYENEELRNLMDVRIFVDTDADIRILRRIERDISERGRSLESIIEQYRETVRPMHIQFVEATKRFADVIIPEGGQNKIGIDMLVARIQAILN
jgi:uridine kinase